MKCAYLLQASWYLETIAELQNLTRLVLHADALGFVGEREATLEFENIFKGKIGEQLREMTILCPSDENNSNVFTKFHCTVTNQQQLKVSIEDPQQKLTGNQREKLRAKEEIAEQEFWDTMPPLIFQREIEHAEDREYVSPKAMQFCNVPYVIQAGGNFERLLACEAYWTCVNERSRFFVPPDHRYVNLGLRRFDERIQSQMRA